MTLTVTHRKVSTLPNLEDARAQGEILPEHWNDTHEILGSALSTTGYATINMNNADYTMTATEAQYSVFLIVNAGDGTKILLNPTSADATAPSKQQFITGFGGNTFFYGSETGGPPTEILAPFNDVVTYTPGSIQLSMFNSFGNQTGYSTSYDTDKRFVTCNNFYDEVERRNGVVNTQTGATYSFLLTDAYGLVVGNRGTAQTFTIEPTATTDMGRGCSLRVQQQGAGNITVAAGAGVTLVGSGALTVNTSKTLKRDGDTDTWYIG